MKSPFAVFPDSIGQEFGWGAVGMVFSYSSVLGPQLEDSEAGGGSTSEGWNYLKISSSCLTVDAGCWQNIYMWSFLEAWASSQHGGRVLMVSSPKDRARWELYYLYSNLTWEVTQHHFHYILFL